MRLLRSEQLALPGRARRARGEGSEDSDLARWTELRDLERRIVREIERDGIAL